MAISEPWSVFTDPDLFGDVAVFTDPANNHFVINGLFDEENVLVFDNLINAEGKRIILAIRYEDLTNVNHGWQVEVRGNKYQIIGVEPIQDGRVLDLILQLPNSLYSE